MKLLLRINPLRINRTSRLLALLLGFCVLWPAPRAVGDGDGVDILPYLGGDDEDARVDDGHREVGSHVQMFTGFMFAWRAGDSAEHPTLAKQLPTPGGRLPMHDMAVAIARSKTLKGLNFVVGTVGVDRNGGLWLFVALAEGGSGKAPVFRCMALR